MTERTQVRFKFYTQNRDITSTGAILPLQLTNFNVGGGTYDATNYKYTFSTAGTYFISYTYIKVVANNSYGRLILERGDNTFQIGFSGGVVKTTGGSFGVSTGDVILYQFQVGDIIYIKLDDENSCRPTPFINPTGDNIFNSFWGVRLDY